MQTLHFGNLANNAAAASFQEAMAIYSSPGPTAHNAAARARMTRHFAIASDIALKGNSSDAVELSRDYLDGCGLVMAGDA